MRTLNRCLKSSLAAVFFLILAVSPFAADLALTAFAQKNADWLTWASVAWTYYQPGVAVNPTTGLTRANLDWAYATDWDLGTNIIAVIMAKRIGLIGDTTPTGWGFKDRIARILSALEGRVLGTKNKAPWPYWAYNWNGSGCGKYCDNFTDTADSARLLFAFDMLRNFDKSYTARVEAIYERTKTAYDEMARQFGANYYDYYLAKAYEAWGYDENTSLGDFEQFKNGPTVNVYGIQIPQIPTIVEPMLFVLLELDRSGVSTTFLNFAERTYETQEARYSNTGLLTGWSEGGYFDAPYYVYEKIYDPLAPPPGTWIITTPSNPHNASTFLPLMYTKIAFSYLAIYGANSFTNALTSAAATLADPSGFGEGTFEDGSRPPWTSANFYSDKTNELVLAAAAYVLSGRPPVFANTTSSTVGTNTISVTGVSPQGLLVAVTGLMFISSLLIARFLRARKNQASEA